MISVQAQQVRNVIQSGLPIDKKMQNIKGLEAYIPEAVNEFKKEHLSAQNNLKNITRRRNILIDLQEWLSYPVQLQPNEHTRAHKLAEAINSRDIENVPSHIAACISSDVYAITQTFVVRHNWAAALGPAIRDAGSEFSLPFLSCIFEFVISGRCVLIWAFQPEGQVPSAVPFVELPSGWFLGDETYVADGGPFYEAWQQIIAICIALDAEVATSNTVEAPSALNKKRALTGKPPVKSFNVVDLARRHRSDSAACGTHRSPRLHFRRGHWRNYETQKTWIRWTLVGNPDLGFVDKRYRI